MKEIISKELLNEVLKEEIIDVEIREHDLLVFYKYKNMGRCKPNINIHELAHKCKEWAFKNGYFLLSGFNESGSLSCEVNIFNSGIGYMPKNICVGKTEPEAIFKACQWILENKG